MKTVSQLKDSVAAILSGIDITNVDNLNGCLERAARTMVQKADIPEASGIQNILLYSGVYDYACDTRIFGTAITDIRPQGISRNIRDGVVKVDQQDFDRTKKYYYPSGTMSTFEFRNGVPIIRITAPFPKQQAVIDTMSSTTGWVVGGAASGLALDSTDYYQSPASLRFNMTTGIGTLIKSTPTQQLDLSDYEDVGVAFLAIQIPLGTTATNLTSVTLRIGSGAISYDSVIATTGFLGSWISGEWLLLSFDFANAVPSGSPDWSAIDYIEVYVVAGAPITNFRVGGLFMSLPTPAQILYQSAAIFLPANSSIASTDITLDTDRIILNNPAYTIYELESALAVLQQVGAGASDSTRAAIMQTLNGGGNEVGLYPMFRGDNPSQEIRTLGSWYDSGDSYGSRDR